MLIRKSAAFLIAIVGFVAIRPAQADDVVGYRFEQIERTARESASLPTPAPFAAAFRAAIARRDEFEHRGRRLIYGLTDDEFDSSGAGRPSVWYVRNDGVVRVDYNYFGHRASWIFDPHRHELLMLDPVKKVATRYATGDDWFYSTPEPSSPSPSPSQTERAFEIELTKAGESNIDGIPTSKFKAQLRTGRDIVDQIDYVSTLSRPPVIPIAGIYQAWNAVDLALQRRDLVEEPKGLRLFHAVRYNTVALIENFKKIPNTANRSSSTYSCQRGAIAPMTADEIGLFTVPLDYALDGPPRPLPQFVFGRDTDDFLAFHLCDDVPRIGTGHQ